MAGKLDEAKRVQPVDRAEWRAWLADCHTSSAGVWLVTFTKASGRPRLEYEDLITEALCFGWVDGTVKALDGERTMIYMSPRRRGSGWARSNKERVERLIAEGLMRPAGLAAIEAAKADGSWTLLDSVEALEVPDDLAAALDEAGVRAGYEAMSPSAKKQVLWSLVSAKRPETRTRRLALAVEAARGAV